MTGGQITSRALTIVGLALVTWGSWVTSRAVIFTANEAINIAGQIGGSPRGLVIPTRDEFLQQPPVQNLIRQSTKAKRGLRWIVGGTLIQIAGVVASFF
jgi:hypothetical protein